MCKRLSLTGLLLAVLFCLQGCAAPFGNEGIARPNITSFNMLADIPDKEFFWRTAENSWSDKAMAEFITAHPLQDFSSVTEFIAIFNVWASLLEMAPVFGLTVEEKCYCLTRKAKVTVAQKEYLPVMRSLFAMHFSETLRASHITVRAYGQNTEKLEFCGELFLDGDFVIALHRSLSALMELLRFDEIFYRASPKSRFAYSCTLSRFNDSSLILWDFKHNVLETIK